MSYYFDMCFTNAENLGEAMVIAQAFVQKMTTENYIAKMMEKESHFIPSVRLSLDEHQERFRIAKAEDEAWLYRLLAPSFVFWPEQKVIALVGYSWPNREEFFFETVCFQNSCDRNYSLDTWPTKIPFFAEIVERHKRMFSMDSKELNEAFYEEPCSENSKDMLEYNIQTDVYDEVYGRLQLDDWLYGKENPEYQRFTLSAITSEEKRFEYIRYLRSLSVKHNPDLWNNNKPIEKKRKNMNKIKFKLARLMINIGNAIEKKKRKMQLNKTKAIVCEKLAKEQGEDAAAVKLSETEF